MMLKKIFFNSKLPVTFGQFIFLYLFVWLAAFTCIREMVIHFFQFFGWVVQPPTSCHQGLNESDACHGHSSGERAG